MMEDSPSVGVVIPAAGAGKRFGGPTPKQYLSLDGRPIILRSLDTALSLPEVTAVVVAIAPTDTFLGGLLSSSFAPDARLSTVTGGAERTESVRRALAHPSLATADVILVHDAVRPLASPLLFQRIIAASLAYGAAIPGVPIADTLKKIDGQGAVVSSVPRQDVRAVQTPQGFRRQVLLQAYEHASDNATDDATLVEHSGFPVQVIEGESWNIKVTTAADLAITQALLRWRSADLV
jgi:2-C-methyl-D-erythritol 4-phosphate cytidylyltransferase